MAAQRLPSDSFINNGGISVAPSSVGGSATGDWYCHRQYFTFAVERQNYIVPNGSYYDDNTVSGATITTDFACSATHNRLLISLDAFVDQTIEYDATYSSSYRIDQEFTVDLALSAGSMTTGLGLANTVIIGEIKRLARKDSSGNILDQVGEQSIYGHKFPITIRNGPYAGSSDSANEIIMEVAQYIKSNLLPNLNISLIHA
jgi:hypothetical protein